MTSITSSEHRCIVCETKLTVHERAVGHTCANILCKTKNVLIKKHQEEEKNNELDLAAQTLASFLVDPSYLYFRVPYNETRIGPVDQNHLKQFRLNLKNALRAAVAVDDDNSHTGNPDKNDSDPPELSQLLGDACATCGGQCCNQAGAHSFLTEATMRQKLSERQSEKPAAIYRDYLSRIPKESFKRACVYQSHSGCVLPRNMRADICNSYECPSLLKIRNQYQNQKQEHALIIATDDSKPRAVGLSRHDATIEFIESPSLKPSGKNRI